MSVKGKYAVLLTKDSKFVKIKNKGYNIGDKLNIHSNAGRFCAAAAGFLVICGGMGSYFAPAGYMSVDINPSVMMTLNIYDRVIDIKPLNSDAEDLIEMADVKWKDVDDTVDILVEKSKEVGYLNENNNDVIIELVSNFGSINISDKRYADVEVVIEYADKNELNKAQSLGISMAKVKAIEEYTKINGGKVEENTEKLWDKSVKEIRRAVNNEPDAVTRATQSETSKNTENSDAVEITENKSARGKVYRAETPASQRRGYGNNTLDITTKKITGKSQPIVAEIGKQSERPINSSEVNIADETHSAYDRMPHDETTNAAPVKNEIIIKDDGENLIEKVQEVKPEWHVNPLPIHEQPNEKEHPQPQNPVKDKNRDENVYNENPVKDKTEQLPNNPNENTSDKKTDNEELPTKQPEKDQNIENSEFVPPQKQDSDNLPPTKEQDLNNDNLQKENPNKQPNDEPQKESPNKPPNDEPQKESPNKPPNDEPQKNQGESQDNKGASHNERQENPSESSNGNSQPHGRENESHGDSIE